MEAQFPILDGQFVNREELVLTPESIVAISQFSLAYVFRASENCVFFFEEQMALIAREASFFRIPLPVHLKERNPIFLRELQRLLRKNKLNGGAKIILTIWRENGIPHYLLRAFQVNELFYKLSDRGSLFEILELPVKSIHPASALPSFSRQLWEVGEVFCKENGFDQCLIQNYRNSLIEVPHGNLFVIKGQNLITADLKSGPVQTVLREKIMRISKRLGLRIFSSEHVTREMLWEADEIFWTNPVSGLEWGMGWKDRRYFCRYSRLILTKLNREVKS